MALGKPFQVFFKEDVLERVTLVAKLVRLGYGALINVDAQGCYYIGGLRPDRAHVEYNCRVQLYSKVPSLKVPISRRLDMSLNHILIKEAIIK